jgi:hypothetical protein
MKEPDKYDKAIAHLVEYPEEIKHAWLYCDSHDAGCLFEFSGSGDGSRTESGAFCGCLTQVRSRQHPAYSDYWTAQIRADSRIPLNACDITVETLPVFAEWQRRLDAEIPGRQL